MDESETTLCILGASGDLTSRLLLPALAQLLLEDPERRVKLIGAGMDDWDDARWRDAVGKAFASADGSNESVEGVREHTTYRRTDITDPDDFRALLDECSGRTAL